MANKGARPPVSRINGKADDESIYRFAEPGFKPTVLPRIKTYDIPLGVPSAGALVDGPPMPNMRSKISHADSTQMDNVLNPAAAASNMRPPPPRPSAKPLNPSRNNVAAVREASQLNQLRRLTSLEKERLQPQGFKALPVPGPVATSAAAARSTSAPRMGAPPIKEGQRNIIADNRVAAIVPNRQRTPTRQDDSYHREFGRVPQYLLERKVDMMEAEEARAAAKEAALIPPGMRLLSEPERQETLGILAKNLEEVMKAIRALPFVCETPSQIRRKDDLEKRLREIEEAQKIFNRPKVFVHA